MVIKKGIVFRLTPSLSVLPKVVGEESRILDSPLCKSQFDGRLLEVESI